MGLNEEIQRIKQCWEQEEAFCQDVCPFHLDVRELLRRLGRGGFNAAFRTYSNCVGFPGLVAALCPAPCQKACPRQQTDAAIDLPRLEQAALCWAANIKPNSYQMPAKEGRFAIVGAGGSGLACALRLCNKKYQVTVYEQGEKLGGRLLEQLPPETVAAELKLQFMYEQYELRLNRPVQGLEGLAALAAVYDGVYVAAGRNSFPELQRKAELPAPWAGPLPGIFLGGESSGCDSITAIAQGLQAAILLESYYKTGEMKGAEVHRPSRIHLDPAALTVQLPQSIGPEGYSRQEAQAEANRCLLCRCDACHRHCPLMGYFEKFPKRIQEEVHVTIHPGTLDGNGTVATRLISTCSQCGLCQEVCPQQIDVGAFFRYSHQAMREKQAMPWAFHEFYLRDLDHASETAALWAGPVAQPAYVFFPGCQLGAVEPDTVQGLYRLLRQYAPDCGIALSCCGAPAVWAGDQARQERIWAELRQHWLDWGRPTLLLACPSCLELLGQYCPELPTRFIGGFLAEQGFTPPRVQAAQQEVAVFDPCGLRHFSTERQAVRNLAAAAGCEMHELSDRGEQAQCCSWGGQTALTNPPYHQWQAQQRAAASPLPYLVSCINCQQELGAAGKECIHLFDLLLGQNSTPKSVDVNQRRRNRELLRAQLWAEFFPQLPPKTRPGQYSFTLATGLAEKLGLAHILSEDVQEVLDAYQANGSGVQDTATGHRYACGPAGQATTWLEFSPYLAAQAHRWLVHNAYQHRMKCEGGPLDEVTQPEAEESNLRCLSCGSVLHPGQVFFSYLGHSFHTTLPRCPHCGQVYISQELVQGRMAQVEMELEDK